MPGQKGFRVGIAHLREKKLEQIPWRVRYMSLGQLGGLSSWKCFHLSPALVGWFPEPCVVLKVFCYLWEQQRAPWRMATLNLPFGGLGLGKLCFWICISSWLGGESREFCSFVAIFFHLLFSSYSISSCDLLVIFYSLCWKMLIKMSFRSESGAPCLNTWCASGSCSFSVNFRMK